MAKQPAYIIASYLDRFGEKEHKIALELVEKKYQRCLVVPCFDEQWASLKKGWEKLSGSWLVVLVINAPPGQGLSGKKLIGEIENSSRPGNQNENLALHSFSRTPDQTIDLLTVDRCTSGLELSLKKGVGQARKIGADIALSLIHGEHINLGLIFNSDADVELPASYGQMHSIDFAAAIYPFIHSLAENKTAILLYEISIYYYQLGLEWAGSSYAYNSLGSTLVIDAVHYARVRGFPKKNAAEDFYIINKLAKTGPVVQLPAPAIKIQSRLSDRVPFGTGPAISKIKELADPELEYLYYHPSVFIALNHFLNLQSQLWDQSDLKIHLSKIPSQYQEPIRSWTQLTGMDQIVKNKKGEIKTKKVFNKFLHDWFDGFRTLKFIHHARDHFFPSVPLGQLFEHNPVFEQASIKEHSSLETIRENLSKH